MSVSKEAERIRKLLAHATSCTNEKEAAAFFAQAAGLQQKYAISHEEILMAEAAAAGRQVSDEPIISRVLWSYERKGELPIWVHVLATSICKLNQSRCLGQTRPVGGQNSCVKGWGRARDLEVCEEMIRVIVAQVRRLCDKYSHDKKIRDNNVLRAFRMGCVNTITERMETTKALADAEVRRSMLPESTTSTALMRLDGIAVRSEQKMREDSPRTSTRAASYDRSGAAYRDGRVQGAGVHFGGHRAIGSGS